MDRFVRNLFEGIDIPHDFPNDEGIAKPATGRPENPIHVSRDADGPRGQVSQTLPEPEINEPEQKVHKYSVPALTAGLSATKSSCSFARPNRKPIFDVKKPFVTPQHFKPSPEPVSQHFKRPREETTQLKSDEAPTQTHDAHINNGALPFARKPVSERYPLKGPAGSILRNPLFDMCAPADGTIRERHAWTRALAMLDSNTSEWGCDFTNYPDFPQHFSASQYVTRKFNIRWIINEASIRNFGFKMDWLVVFVLSQRTLGMYVMYVFIDKSGQMLGCMNEELHLKLKHIAPGCALILKNVFVYIPVGCKPYLLIKEGDVAAVVQNGP